jgi:hypothetical protein
MMALVMPVPLVRAIGYGDSGWGYLYFIPKFIQNDSRLCKRSIKMASDIKLTDNAVVVEGNLGIGTATPGRQVHVEGNEIHSGGPGAGFSFSDRTTPGLVNSPQNGERWVWYAHDGTARLWSGEDVLEIRDIAKGDGKLPELRINGDLHVGGKLSGGDVSRLDGVELTLPDLPPVKRVHVYADAISFDGSTGKPEKFGLRTDFANGKELLVLNYPPNPYGKSFKDGVRIEGNLHVNGTLTQASSIALKDNVATLSGQEALATLRGLRAVKYTYKADERKQQRLGFIAEDVPELVATAERDSLGPMDIIAVLTKAMQEQQQTITALIARVNSLVEQGEGSAT